MDRDNFDWNSEEGKHIDKSAAQDGLVRKVVPLGTDENGEPFGFICWRKP